MVEWILVLTLSTGAGGGAAVETVGTFQTISECSVAGGTWVNNKSNGAMVRDYVCLKRTKSDANNAVGNHTDSKSGADAAR